MSERERSGQNSRQKEQQVEPNGGSISDVVKEVKANRAETEGEGGRKYRQRAVTGPDFTGLR